ncbi:SDR family oxidoreductase [Hahella sp. KA22]|uniref:oxidoreductase n=1 Tax=Hahella sp. KA22 TaxID=1628392 RepID=UPI000FDDF95E|nr:oxidoreductase [Hahella sp. KA22]AZZ91280.1 SDR family oxidoreductase [Hahella sp. KA22]QAY54649.1 SDR family oxidoreductase [Hahella sp. KA22]
MKQLEGKVVVITGGCGLLGGKFCRAVLQAGGRVAVADIDLSQAKLFAESLQSEFGQEAACAVKCDVTDKESILNAIAATERAMGAINALVNSAYPRNKHYGRSFFDVEYEDFCGNLSLHLGGYFLASQQFARHFVAQGGGNIVNIASIYGVTAPRFDIYQGTTMTMPVEYAAIKSALIHLTRYMAKFLRGTGVKVNAISPGGIADGQPEAFLQAYAEYCSEKGMLDPDDICGALVFLLSDASRYINGGNLIVDDGFCL